MTSDERFMVEHDLPLLERMCGMLRTAMQWAKEKPEVTTGYFRTPIIFGNEFPVNFTLNIPAKAMAQIWEANKSNLELHIQRLKDLKNEETQA